MDWIDLAQDWNKWRPALVNAVMNLHIAEMRGISWLSWGPARVSKKTAPWSYLFILVKFNEASLEVY